MAKVKVKPNSSGILQALNSNGVKEALDKEAQEIATKAKASAPVESGAYRDSIHTESGTGRDRAVAYVVADADHALVVEAHTGNLLKAAVGGDA